MTSGLKRVTDDMKSKNRSDRSGMVPASASGSRPPAQALKGADEPSQSPRQQFILLIHLSPFLMIMTKRNTDHQDVTMAISSWQGGLCCSRDQVDAGPCPLLSRSFT